MLPFAFDRLAGALGIVRPRPELRIVNLISLLRLTEFIEPTVAPVAPDIGAAYSTFDKFKAWFRDEQRKLDLTVDHSHLQYRHLQCVDCSMPTECAATMPHQLSLEHPPIQSMPPYIPVNQIF